MPVTHTFVSAKPASSDPTIVDSTKWNDGHAVDIFDSDVNPAAGIVESKLSLNFPTHAALTLGVSVNGLSLAGQVLSLGLASSGATGALSGTDWDTFNGKQAALTFPLASTLGGTGVNNAGTLTNASNTTITGGGTVALGGFTLTVPATGTAALLATANVFTENQQLNTGKTLIFQDTSDTRGVSMGIRYSSAGSSGTFIGFTPTVANQRGGFEIYPNGSGAFSTFYLYGGGTPNSATYQRFYIQSNKTGGVSLGQQASGSGYAVGDFVINIPATFLWWLTKPTTTNNGVLEAQRIEATVSTASTGSANGFGVGQSFYAETATDGTNQQQGLISTSWIDATNASRKAKMSLSAYDTAARLGIEIEASGTAVKLGFFGGTTAVQQALNAYTSDGEGAAYTGIDNAQAGTVYATVVDLNQLRVAYETLRASYDDLRTKLQTSTIVA